MTFQRIEFEVAGVGVVGHLCFPSDRRSFPSVVVGGPMTSVKEQVTGVYAKALADRGVAALCLDHRHYGESGGAPRQYEFYQHKIDDLKAAVAYLREAPGIDADRIGAAGVCLGAGYAAWASAGDDAVKAFGAVVGYYRDPALMRRADPEGFDAKVRQGIDARRYFEKTGEVETIPAAALTGDAAMTLQSTYDYYATPRAGVPNYVNAFAVMSREHFLTFDVQSAASQLSVPVRMVHSENALSPSLARSFFDRLECSKSIHWLDGDNQTAFYDAPQLVAQSADLLAEHFHEHL
ncbi:MAG: dienelactone hydrolase family protein [Pseudomonadota bacterium]